MGAKVFRNNESSETPKVKPVGEVVHVNDAKTSGLAMVNLDSVIGSEGDASFVVINLPRAEVSAEDGEEASATASVLSGEEYSRHVKSNTVSGINVKKPTWMASLDGASGKQKE